MVEDILHTKKFEEDRDQENGVRRIAALYDLKTAAQIDPPRVKEFPEKGGAVLPDITESAIAFFRHWMPIDVDSFQKFVSFAIVLPSGTQNRDLVTVVPQRRSFLPDPRIERDGQVFDDNQNLSFQTALLRCAGTARPARSSWSPGPNAGWESCWPATASIAGNKSTRCDPAYAVWSTGPPCRPVRDLPAR